MWEKFDEGIKAVDDSDVIGMTQAQLAQQEHIEGVDAEISSKMRRASIMAAVSSIVSLDIFNNWRYSPSYIDCHPCFHCHPANAAVRNAVRLQQTVLPPMGCLDVCLGMDGRPCHHTTTPLARPRDATLGLFPCILAECSVARKDPQRRERGGSEIEPRGN